MADSPLALPPQEDKPSDNEKALSIINEEQPYGFCFESWMMGHQQQTVQTLQGPQTGVREFPFMSACYGPFCQSWDGGAQRCGLITAGRSPKKGSTLRPKRELYPTEAEAAPAPPKEPSDGEKAPPQA